MMSRHSIAHAHIEPTSSRSTTGARSVHYAPRRPATSPPLDSKEDEAPAADSSDSSDYELEAVDTLGRISSRSLLPRSESVADGPLYSLDQQISARRSSAVDRRLSHHHAEALEAGIPAAPVYQSIPPEFSNLTAEIVFIIVCSTGQLLNAHFQGNILVNMFKLVPVLEIKATQTPWLLGSYLLANGLSVVISGSLADLAPPRALVVGAFGWLTIWNIIGAFALTPSLKILFFIVRSAQGLAMGVLVSASMSILGRIYNPGQRKTRVFSAMSAGAPFGFWLGTIQGGALTAHLSWIFWSTALVCGLVGIAAFLTIPSLKPAKDAADADAPSLRNFDYIGAAFSSIGCGCLLFGLTQGTAARWSPYTYAVAVLGLALLVGFFFVERRVQRPLIPNGLWSAPGFLPLAVAYFLGYGSYCGAWQFYIVQFWLTIQKAAPIHVALYLLPNAIVGVLATWLVARTLHKFPGHWILTASMISYALGPAFFLPQKASSNYWALGMPGVALATFGPDLSFAAMSVFITSSVPRSYQGAAGSVLVTVQNLASAIITSLSDTVGVEVDTSSGGGIGLEGLRAIWWFGLGLALAAALITVIGVRIPKAEEKEHVR